MSSSFDQLLAHGDVVLLDGATGTELERRGYAAALPLWTAEAAERVPDLLRAVHREYLAAGAEIITANTFRTTAYTFRKLAREADAWRLAARSVEIAREACVEAGRGLVAGAMAPIEDCYDVELVPATEILHREHAAKARFLADAGVDLLLVETMSTAREARAASEAALATGLPVLTSLILDPHRSDLLLGGDSFATALLALRGVEVEGRRIDGFLVNCAPRTVALEALEGLRASAGSSPIGAYANVGAVDPVIGWRREPATGSDAFGAWARQARDRGARFLGGCCGTTPADIEAMHRVLRAANERRAE